MMVIGACTSAPPPTLRRPNYVAIHPDGGLWVSDLHNGRVVHFDAEGDFVTAIGRRGLGRGELWRVRGLTALPDGGIAVVNHRLVDLESQNVYLREVKVFGPDGGERLVFDPRPPEEKAQGWPEGIDAFDGGYVVADRNRDALLFFDEQGRYQRSLRTFADASPPVDPASPRVVDDRVCFTEHSRHQVRCVGLEDGRQKVRFGREGREEGALLFPWSVDVSPEGWFVVADLGNFRLQRFDARGRFMDVIEPEPASDDSPPQWLDVAVDPEGRLVMVDSKGSRVLIQAPDAREPDLVLSAW